jgi:hypothetical protein
VRGTSVWKKAAAGLGLPVTWRGLLTLAGVAPDAACGFIRLAVVCFKNGRPGRTNPTPSRPVPRERKDASHGLPNR